MAMLYMTPVLPLGPVSYMVGTTSMRLSSFAIAKVASLPLMILYVFIGASTGTLLSDPAGSAKEIEENKTLIILGILLSAVMITGISHYIRKELDKVHCRVFFALFMEFVWNSDSLFCFARYWAVKSEFPKRMATLLRSFGRMRWKWVCNRHGIARVL